ncbi:Mov34/MPN/PAD-1 family protein [Paenibacillus tarimensis]
MSDEQTPNIAVYPGVLSKLIHNCETELPSEACGILYGDSCRIESVLPISNRSDKPQTGFSFDPQQWIEAYYTIIGSGKRILGFYHSHPSGTSWPSASDYAGWPEAIDASLWIVAFHENNKPASVHAYRMKDDRFFPIKIVQNP